MAAAAASRAAVQGSSGLLYLPGIGSPPGGRKERCLEAFANARSLEVHCVAYRLPLGHENLQVSAEALSSLEAALQDSAAALDRLRAPRVTVVAASLGAWLAAGLAEMRPSRVASLLLLAPTAGELAHRMLPGQSPGTAILPSEHSASGGYAVSAGLAAEVERRSIAEMVPGGSRVCIMHGDEDKAVSHTSSESLAAALQKRGVSAHFRLLAGEDHRLSSPAALTMLEAELHGIMNDPEQ
eukprot:TRINITY_DN56958_c0_g1_i1.p1 TRINITY_DN56958_c0_g1~~TRINITY_DN56958_c0_g1_i1.p1  ORF type:complete len:249 (+),score=46.87 TRINITY_DN56958_c0_g1_i1:29-748(+)